MTMGRRSRLDQLMHDYAVTVGFLIAISLLAIMLEVL